MHDNFLSIFRLKMKKEVEIQRKLMMKRPQDPVKMSIYQNVGTGKSVTGKTQTI